MKQTDTQTALSNLIELGFTVREAEFLQLIGTNTGVFTMGQYRRFTGAQRGWSTHNLLKKLDRYSFGTAIKLSQFLTVHHLHHKRFYAAVRTPDSRLRRRMSIGMMRQRLQYADFIVANLGYEFFGPESHKVEFFCTTLGLDAALLPTGEWVARDETRTTTRFFPERFPIFSDEETGAPTPGFVYGEDPNGRFSLFSAFLKEHRALIEASPSPRLVYISPHSRRREMAPQVVRSVFAGQPTLMTLEVEWYFTMRHAIESGRNPGFTHEEGTVWAYARQRFTTPEHEELYLNFSAQGGLSGAPSCARTPPVNLETFEPFTHLEALQP